MSYSKPARTAAQRTRPTILAALVVASAALIGARVYQSRATPSSSAQSSIAIVPGDNVGIDDSSGEERMPPQPPRQLPATAGTQPAVGVTQTHPPRSLTESA